MNIRSFAVDSSLPALSRLTILLVLIRHRKELESTLLTANLDFTISVDSDILTNASLQCITRVVWQDGNGEDVVALCGRHVPVALGAVD